MCWWRPDGIRACTAPDDSGGRYIGPKLTDVAVSEVCPTCCGLVLEAMALLGRPEAWPT